VLKTTKNAQIRRFATSMIGDHGKTTATVTAAARAAKIPPKPPMLDAPKATMVRQLNATRGTARDRLYIQQQKTAHQEALALHQDYAASGTEPHLKAAATAAVPIVQHHLEMLNGMKM
jgi:putative membrane protein